MSKFIWYNYDNKHLKFKMTFINVIKAAPVARIILTTYYKYKYKIKYKQSLRFSIIFKLTHK